VFGQVGATGEFGQHEQQSDRTTQLGPVGRLPFESAPNGRLDLRGQIVDEVVSFTDDLASSRILTQQRGGGPGQGLGDPSVRTAWITTAQHRRMTRVRRLEGR
jgi:hypothetical protein